MKTYLVDHTATFEVLEALEFIAPHMKEWRRAVPGLLTVHAGDKLRALSAEGEKVLAALFVEHAAVE